MFLGQSRALTLIPEDGRAFSPPDPASIFTLPGEPGQSASPDRNARYQDIARSLQADAALLDHPASGRAAGYGRAIAAALLEANSATTIDTLLTIARWALLVGFIVFSIGGTYRTAIDAPAGPFGYGALYFGAALLLSVVLTGFAGAAGHSARTAFARARDGLVALVAETTGAFHEKLVTLRAQMEANSRSDYPQAVQAASEARLLTVAAIGFFRSGPIINVDGEGFRCEILAGALRARAAQALASGGTAFGYFVLTLVGAAAGALALYFSISGPLTFLPPPPLVADIVAAEAARPGIVSLALAAIVALIAPLLFGPSFAQIAARANPQGVLSSHPARALANDLQARALAAAAERQREMIERYADALLSLEARAREWAGSARSHAAAPETDTPSWRKAPEGPRFVEQSFQAAPKTFRVAPAEDPAGRKERRPFFSPPTTSGSK